MRYLNWYLIYNLSVWKLHVLDYFLSLILFHQQYIQRKRAHWINRARLIFPERLKLTVRLFGYQILLWVSVKQRA